MFDANYYSMNAVRRAAVKKTELTNNAKLNATNQPISIFNKDTVPANNSAKTIEAKSTTETSESTNIGSGKARITETRKAIETINEELKKDTDSLAAEENSLSQLIDSGKGFDTQIGTLQKKLEEAKDDPAQKQEIEKQISAVKTQKEENQKKTSETEDKIKELNGKIREKEYTLNDKQGELYQLTLEERAEKAARAKETNNEIKSSFFSDGDA